MTRMICHKTMQECQNTSECAPYQGCGNQRILKESKAAEAAKSPLDRVLEKEIASAVKSKSVEPQKGEYWYIMVKGASCVKRQIVSDITLFTIELCDDWNSLLKSRYRRVDVEMVEKCK